jgi:hypothetical protein
MTGKESHFPGIEFKRNARQGFFATRVSFAYGVKSNHLAALR